MRTALVVLAVLAVLLTGCTSDAPEFVDAGKTYTQPQLQERLASIDTESLKQTPVLQASTLRSKSLAALRGEGETAAAAATLITKSFPSGTAAVPVYVEKATYTGDTALVIVEAYGPSTGTLDRKRLWVISADGQVLFSAASK